MAEYTFKKHELTDAARAWLNAAAEPQFDPKVAKVKLRTLLPPRFNPETIDRRLYSNKFPTPVGRWHLNANDPLLAAAGKVATYLQKEIFTRPGIEQFSSTDVAANIGLAQQLVQQAFYLLGEFGGFHGSAGGSAEPREYSSIHMSGDNAYDAYLAYTNIEDLLEQYYLTRDAATPVSSANVMLSNLDFGSWPMNAMVQPKPEIKSGTAFVLMSFDPKKPQLEDFYQAIKGACAEFGITAYRADAIEHQESITSRILNEISTCEFLIADLSDERPNVYYEVGYAHALRRNPILFRHEGTPLHFDLLVHNVPHYRNATDLRAKVIKRLSAILGREPSSSSKTNP